MSSSRAVLSLVILFTTGLCSMGLEVIWTRAFTTVLGTYVYSFALLLFTYLWATWLGSWIYRRDIRNGSVAATPRMLAILGIAGLLPIVLNDPRVGPRSMMLVLSSIIPFCATLGYLTPKLIDQYSNGQPRGAGRAYAVNVVGCILGPLVAGYMLLPTLGARHSMTFLTVPFLVLFATFWTSPALTAAWRGVTGIASAALLACATFVSLSYEEGPAWTRAEIRRDYTATVVSFGEGMRKQLVVNGVGITSMTPLTKLMAHLPLAIHGRAQSVAVICLGMGTTFRSALSWDVNTTAVELAGSVRDAFPYYFDDAFKLMDDPRGRIVIDDGRRFLQRTTDRFDIVTIDPPPPLEAAGSSLLYSKEFYEIVKTRLNDGGILQHWSPGGEPLIQNAIARSLIEAFGYVTAFRAIEGGGIHYVASMQPFRIPSVDDFVARLPQAAQQDLIEWNEGELRDVRVFAGMVLDKQIGIQELLYPDPDVVITDDRPFNEYYWLRRNVGRDLRPDWALAGS